MNYFPPLAATSETPAQMFNIHLIKKTPASRRSASLCGFGVMLSVLVAAPLATRGATLTWDNNSNGTDGATDGAGTWNTTNTNWYPGGTAPQTDVVWPNSGSDTAIFGSGGTAGTVTVATGISAGTIQFNSLVNGSGGYTLTGGSLNLGTGGFLIFNLAASSGGNPTFTTPITATNLSIQDTAAASTTGGVVLNGSNTLTGITTIGGGGNNGLVQVNNANALNGGGAVSVLTGTTLRVAVPGTYNNNFTLSGTGVGARGALSLGGATNPTSPIIFTGQVSLAGNASIANTSAQGLGFVTGAIGESGGARTLNLVSQVAPITVSGVNTYSGGTTITAGGDAAPASGILGERILFNNTSGSAAGTGTVTLTAGSATIYPTIGGGNDAATSVTATTIGASAGTATMLGTGANKATSSTYAAGVRGILAGTVSMGAFSHLSPGNGTQTSTAGVFTASVGTLTVGALTLSTNNVLDYDFNTTAKTNDFTAVTGALTLGTGTTVNLFQEGSTNTYLATAGIYNLLSYGTLAGSLSGITVATASQQSGFNYAFINDTTDNLIQLQVTAVPEPSTWVGTLVCLGLFGFKVRRRLTGLFRCRA